MSTRTSSRDDGFGRWLSNQKDAHGPVAVLVATLKERGLILSPLSEDRKALCSQVMGVAKGPQDQAVLIKAFNGAWKLYMSWKRP